MDELTLKKTLASRLAYFRKANNLTQVELAEKINYSDKSISKWERGDGVPDIFVLSMLAEIYGITVDSFLSESVEEIVVEDAQERRFLTDKNRLLITLLAAGLVWLIASIVFFILKVSMPTHGKLWYTFIIAMPISLIVTVVFTELWGNLVTRAIAVSLLVWSLAVSIDVCLQLDYTYLIYIVSAVLQLLVIFWYLLKFKPRKESLEAEDDDSDETTENEE
ncbi:MAG: helix-turn-helix transcriptional regulator [Clostridia bacterium]|nr:helix-turn-helix transcriptional regulator [Clostridia bacterium]